MMSATKLNGINLETIQATVSAVKDNPGLGRCRFRASNKWSGGTQNATTLSDFFAAGQEHQHQKPFRLNADEPPLLAGEDRAPNPVEHLLNALAGCITTSMVAHAAVRGIEIEELESQLEGDIDLRGFLGLANDVPKGFTNIRVNFRVKADPARLEQLRQLAEFSPVYNTISHGANVQISLQAA